VSAPGLEAWCAAELSELGVRIRRTLHGGVEFSATARQLYAANLWSRTASRIVVRVAAFTATDFGALTRQAADVPWEQWIPPGTTPTVRASSTASKLYHTGGIAERLAELASTGPEPGPMIVARLIHDRVMLSVDSSGIALYQRGWKRDSAKAPLRETLAAAALLASGWDRQSPVVDPMCGSGTIAIEAALMAAGMPAGGQRRFAFQDWPSFEPGTWASVTGQAAAAAGARATTPIVIARDRDQGAVKATAANAARAGVAEFVDVAQGTVSDLVAPGSTSGLLITNPPYGKRISDGGDLRDLFARFGDVARTRFGGWTIALLVADPRLAGHTGLDTDERLRTENGGIPVRLLVAGTIER
jgi:putative N6-adenine-specific DNA methylase